jgi:hypothetical protein
VISPVAKHLPSFARPAPQNSLYERHCIRSVRNCADERVRGRKAKQKLNRKVCKELLLAFFARFAAFFATFAVKSFSPSLELPLRRSLFRAHAPRDNLGCVIILALHRRTGEAPQHRELPHVRERIRNRPLK